MTLQELIDQYPILQNVECGVYIGEGWVPLIRMFCKMVEWHKSLYPESPDVIIGQIKEKFGTMRLYIDQGDDFIRGAASMVENISCLTCEDCGNEGKVRSGGWIRTLCDTCEVEQKKLRK